MTQGEKIAEIEKNQADFAARIEALRTAVKMLLERPIQHAVSSEEAKAIAEAKEAL
jgi:hypothetical protein